MRLPTSRLQYGLSEATYFHELRDGPQPQKELSTTLEDSHMTKKEFYTFLAEALEENPSVIHDELILADLGGWNSLGVLVLISMADEKLGAPITPERLEQCKTPLDLATLFNATE